MVAVKVDEAVDAAQQIFEGTADEWQGDLKGRAVYIKAVLLRWPWLRPNRYQPRRTEKAVE